MDIPVEHRIEENTQEYYLFYQPDKVLTVEEVYAKLAEDLNDYIWQNGTLTLAHKTECGDVPEHLYGRLDYADNVEDLWFVTYLLRKLTLQTEGLVVKTRDVDGEFLLIEAADHLPKWLKPETAENRIFLYNGALHIIPIANTPGEITPIPSGTPLLSTAVECVRNQSEVTKAGQKIQRAVSQRIDRYPDYAKQSVHRTSCNLPLSAARLLTAQPQIISEAVRAFYLRDSIDLRLANKCKHFTPENRVMCKVKMTRCMYAQLLQQKFYPQKRSDWNLPSEHHPNFKQHDLAMKIAHGLSILVGNAEKSSNTQINDRTNEQTNSHDKVTDSVSWKRYLTALNKYDYFKGEIEGSIRYKQLYEQAKQFFINQSETSQVNTSTEHCSRTVVQGRRILELLENCSITEEEIIKSSQNLTPDDDDSWLYLSYDDLNHLLSDHQPVSTDQNQFDAGQIVDKMSTFINKQSNILSGVEIPNDSEVKFDDRGFLAAVEKMINGNEKEFNASDTDSLDDYDSDDSLPAEPIRTQLNKSDQSQPSVYKNQPLNSQHTTKTDQSKSQTNGTSNGTKKKGKAPVAEEPEIEDFMDMMDRELSSTHVGQSFYKQKNNSKNKHTQNIKTENNTAADSRLSLAHATLAGDESFSEGEDSEADIDIDLNTVKNLLESYSNQMGLPGPTSTVLESMGVKLPQNSDI